MENTLTIPSMVTLTTLSPDSLSPAMSCTPMLIVVCCPKRTIFWPDRQSQHTRALSAPADTRFLDESATARMPLRCPASCCRGLKVTDEYRWTRLEQLSIRFHGARRIVKTYPTSWNPATNTSEKEINGTKLELLECRSWRMTVHLVRTFFEEEVYAAHRLFNLKTLLLLSCVNVPKSDRLVVGTADEPFAPQKQCRTEICMASEEA